MPRRGIEPQSNDQRITDYPTAPQRRNRIISVYQGHSQLGPIQLNQDNVFILFRLNAFFRAKLIFVLIH